MFTVKPRVASDCTFLLAWPLVLQLINDCNWQQPQLLLSHLTHSWTPYSFASPTSTNLPPQSSALVANLLAIRITTFDKLLHQSRMLSIHIVLGVLAYWPTLIANASLFALPLMCSPLVTLCARHHRCAHLSTRLCLAAKTVGFGLPDFSTFRNLIDFVHPFDNRLNNASDPKLFSRICSLESKN